MTLDAQNAQVLQEYEFNDWNWQARPYGGDFGSVAIRAEAIRSKAGSKYILALETTGTTTQLKQIDKKLCTCWNIFKSWFNLGPLAHCDISIEGLAQYLKGFNYETDTPLHRTICRLVNKLIMVNDGYRRGISHALNLLWQKISKTGSIFYHNSRSKQLIRMQVYYNSSSRFGDIYLQFRNVLNGFSGVLAAVNDLFYLKDADNKWKQQFENLSQVLNSTVATEEAMKKYRCVTNIWIRGGWVEGAGQYQPSNQINLTFSADLSALPEQ